MMKSLWKKTALIAVAVCGLMACGQAPEGGNATLDTILSRKSVRSYTDQPVSIEQVETLLRAAMAAPTGMNLQPWRFVVVTDQAVKDVLAGERGRMIATAPTVIVVCGETTALRRPRGAAEDAEPVEVENVLWTADCAAAAENLLLVAESLGLGAVWTACYPFEDRMAPARDVLGLPDNVSPYCIIPVGYPAGDDQPKDKWKPENIHYDRW